MGETEILTTITQFGVAGLIAWMWLSERRSASARERQLTEAHEGLMRSQKELDILTSLLERNARAMASLEAGQRELTGVLRELASRARVRAGGGQSGEAA